MPWRFWFGREHEVAARRGERFAVRRAPLPPIGSLVTWTMTAWPALRSCSIRGAGPSMSSGAVVHLAGVEHTVAAAADVDERRLHAREHVLHPPEVDVADHRGRAGAGHVVLDEDVFFQDRDLVALTVLGDRHQLVGDPRRRRRLLAAPAAVAAGAGSGGADASGGTARGDLLFDRLGLLGPRRVLGGGLVGPLAAPAAARLRRAAPTAVGVGRRIVALGVDGLADETVGARRLRLRTAPATATPAPALLRTRRLPLVGRPRRRVGVARGLGLRLARPLLARLALGLGGRVGFGRGGVIIGRGPGSAGCVPAATAATPASASSSPASTGAGRRRGFRRRSILHRPPAAHRWARRRRLASCVAAWVDGVGVAAWGAPGPRSQPGSMARPSWDPTARPSRGSIVRAPLASARRRASPRPRWASPAPCPNRSCGGW